MSNCRRCRCSESSCGCSDGPLLTTSLPQTSSTCPTPQVCSEFTYSGCIVYNGPSLVDVNIYPGMDMNQVIQSLMLYISNAGCAVGDGAVFINANYVTLTSFNVVWNLMSSAVTYDVHYSVTGSGTWTNITGISPTTANQAVTGLTCGTSYDIYVTVNYTLSSCDSQHIRLTTLDC